MPVTLDGEVLFRFDVEMVASRFELIIDAVRFKVETNTMKDPEDVIYLPLAQGGWEIRQYELDLASQPVTSSDGVRIYEAIIQSHGEPIQGVTLKPGERESLEVVVDLDKPGAYTLTPIFHYRFRDESLTLEADSYHFIFPHRYRVWSLWSPHQGDWGIGTHNIMADTQSSKIQMPELPGQTASACLSSPHWIAFESSMITYGGDQLNRLFLIDTQAQDLEMIMPQDQQMYSRYLEWTNDHKLLIGEPVWIEELMDQVPEVRSLDPQDGKIEVIESDELPALEAAFCDPWPEICLKGGSGCIVGGFHYDTNGDGQVNGQDPVGIYLQQNDRLTWLGPSTTRDRAYPALSPDETWIAYVEGKVLYGYWGPCGSPGGQNVYVMPLDGGEPRQITDAFGWYRNPTWSPDGRYLAFESARLADNGGELVCDQSIYHIYVIDLETGKEMQLTSGPSSDYQPRWSADGQWVLAGGDRLSLSRRDGSCTQDVFVPPVGWISNVLMEP